MHERAYRASSKGALDIGQVPMATHGGGRVVIRDGAAGQCSTRRHP
jgi:hypothetical protein